MAEKWPKRILVGKADGLVVVTDPAKTILERAKAPGVRYYVLDENVSRKPSVEASKPLKGKDED